MTGIKRLTPRQSRKVNTLVKKECCNCENGNCILLDDGDTCVCPQLISYSLLCKWFRIAVLPLDKLLYAELYFPRLIVKPSACNRASNSSKSDTWGIRVSTASFNFALAVFSFLYTA